MLDFTTIKVLKMGELKKDLVPSLWVRQRSYRYPTGIVPTHLSNNQCSLPALHWSHPLVPEECSTTDFFNAGVEQRVRQITVTWSLSDRVSESEW